MGTGVGHVRRTCWNSHDSACEVQRRHGDHSTEQYIELGAEITERCHPVTSERQPFSAPLETPSMKRRCKTRKKTTVGMAIMVAVAICCGTSLA